MFWAKIFAIAVVAAFAGSVMYNVYWRRRN
jgi:hypothetical protein